MNILKKTLIGCTALLLTSTTAYAQDSFHFSISSGGNQAYYGIGAAFGSLFIHSSGIYNNYGHDHYYEPPRHHRHHGHHKHHRPHYRRGHRHGPVYGWNQPHHGHHKPHYGHHQPHRGHQKQHWGHHKNKHNHDFGTFKKFGGHSNHGQKQFGHRGRH